MSLILIKNDPEERFRDPKQYLIRRKKELQKLYPDLLKIVLGNLFFSQEQLLTFYAILEKIDIPREISIKEVEKILSQNIDLMNEYTHLSKHLLLEIESHLVFLKGDREIRSSIRIAVAKILAVIRLR